MKISDLSGEDKKRIASLIQELSSTCSQLDHLQTELQQANTQNSNLSTKVETLETEKNTIKTRLHSLESDRLDKAKEYETNVKQLYNKIVVEKERKEGAKKNLTSCKKELSQLQNWNKKLQGDFIELQQLQILKNEEINSKPASEVGEPVIMEIPKLSVIEEQLKEIKKQIGNCALFQERYGDKSGNQKSVVKIRDDSQKSMNKSTRNSPLNSMKNSPMKLKISAIPIAQLDLETSLVVSELNSSIASVKLKQKTRPKNKMPDKNTTSCKMTDLEELQDLFFIH